MGPDGAGARVGKNDGAVDAGGAGIDATGRELMWLPESNPEIRPTISASSHDIRRPAEACSANRRNYSAAWSAASSKGTSTVMVAAPP